MVDEAEGRRAAQRGRVQRVVEREDRAAPIGEPRIRLNDSWSGVSLWIPIENFLPKRQTYWVEHCMNPKSDHPNAGMKKDFKAAMGKRGPFLTSLGEVVLTVLLVSDASSSGSP